MNSEIKTKWVSALRSGDYKQGTGFLRKNSCYCAAGILCDLYSIDTGIQWELDIGESGRHSIDGVWNFPSKDVLTWAGIIVDNNSPDFIAYRRVISENDHHGKSFSEIADYIEENIS